MGYLGNWSSVEDVVGDFRVSASELDGAEILVAWYGYGDYDGSAFVLFERDGKLYEVNGGHCSCFGLERQWEPEETTVEALEHFWHSGRYNYYEEHDACAKAVRQFLDSRRET